VSAALIVARRRAPPRGDRAAEQRATNDTLRLSPALVQADIDANERAYLRDRNSMRPWRAIRQADRTGLPLPTWVRKYLAACAHNMHALSENLPVGVDRAVTAAVGFAKPGRTGPGSPFSELRDTVRRRQRAMMAACFIEQGDKPQMVYEAVAALCGVSPATVRRDHIRFQKVTTS
jgi:hypothetical protein